MTNDELKSFLNGWYHEQIKGKCVHEYKRMVINGYVYRDCVKCDYCSQVHGLIDLEPMWPPDYLSDPAVMWGIVIKLIDDGYEFGWIGGFAVYKRHGESTAPNYDDKLLALPDSNPERAVMLALKAKHAKRAKRESRGQ